MEVSEPSVAGSAVLDGRHAYTTIVGAALFTASLAKLHPRDAAVYEATTPVSWVPVRIVDELIVHVASAVRENPVELNARATRVSVERTVRTVLRPLLRFTSDEALLARAPIFYRRSFSHGTLGVFSVEGTRSILALVDWPGISDVILAGVGAGIVAVLAVAGRPGAAVRTKRSPTGALFTVTSK